MTAPDAPDSSTPPAFRWEFEAIGTRWRIDTAVELSATVRSEVGVLIDAFDRAWSRFRPDAEIAALATAAGSIPAPVDAAPMLDLFLALSEATAEAVNPLIGDALARRGYDAQYGLVDHGAQAAPAGWSQLLTWGGDRLTLRTPATIDVGALGKGRLVDRVLRRVAAHVEGAVTVDAGDDFLDRIVAAMQPDLLQLHGRETPERVAAVKARHGLPVMKALPVGTAADLDGIAPYRGVADRFLFDARPPAGSELPGGNGVSFDWTILAGVPRGVDYLLSGGLNAGNAADAIRLARPPGLDVSSGVESAPGVGTRVSVRLPIGAAAMVEQPGKIITFARAPRRGLDTKEPLRLTA